MSEASRIMRTGARAPVRPRPAQTREDFLRGKAIRLLDRVIMPDVYRTFAPRALEHLGEPLQRALVSEAAMATLAAQDHEIAPQTVVELQRALWAEINHRYPGV